METASDASYPYPDRNADVSGSDRRSESCLGR